MDSRDTPYLTLVVVGRNDNYGKGFLDRFQIFLNNQFYLWKKTGLGAELVVVEWNPPADRPRLKDALTWPRALTNGSVRIITVPSLYHRRVAGGKPQGMFEYLGKNVGVRRARGEYVLATNPDLIYSEELIQFFASRALESKSFYRVNRHDMPLDTIPQSVSPEVQLKLCEERYRYVHNNLGAMFVRGEHPLGFRNVRRIATYAKNRLKFFPYPPPYMNAAGDFFLMHQDEWRRFGGYPELDHYAYPDALCFMALSGGLRQVILKPPCVIYHQDHERGGRETGRPRSDFEKNKLAYFRMLRKKAPWLPNGPGWGLANEQLEEAQVL